MDWQRLFVVPHTLRADYQSLPQAQLCLYSSVIFRNSVAMPSQSLFYLMPRLRSHLQVAPWSLQQQVLVTIIMQIINYMFSCIFRYDTTFLVASTENFCPEKNVVSCLIWSIQMTNSHIIMFKHTHQLCACVYICIMYHLSAPTGAPSNLTYAITSRYAIFSWHQIDCVERNGVITNYTVVFQEQGGAVIPGEVNVMDRTFTASGLTPHTNYIFRVAGVNSNGTGPYSKAIMVMTEEDGNVIILQYKSYNFHF